MNSRFFLIASLLAIISLLAHFASREWTKHARYERALLIGVPDSHHHRYTDDDPEIRRLRLGPDLLSNGGVALTVLALGCMLIAKARRERGLYVILSILLIADIIAPILLSIR